MDDTDRRLVEALRADARASYAQLARSVGLSAPSVQERVRRLERRGVLTGFHAVVDPTAVGLGVSALVSIHQADYAEQDDVAGRLAAVAEIEDCWLVAGEEAFVVKVRVPDVIALEHTIAKLRRVEGVSRTQTTVVLSTRWEGRAVALPDLEDHGVMEPVPDPANGDVDNEAAAAAAGAEAASDGVTRDGATSNGATSDGATSDGAGSDGATSDVASVPAAAGVEVASSEPEAGTSPAVSADSASSQQVLS